MYKLQCAHNQRPQACPCLRTDRFSKATASHHRHSSLLATAKAYRKGKDSLVDRPNGRITSGPDPILYRSWRIRKVIRVPTPPNRMGVISAKPLIITKNPMKCR